MPTTTTLSSPSRFERWEVFAPNPTSLSLEMGGVGPSTSRFKLREVFEPTTTIPSHKTSNCWFFCTHRNFSTSRFEQQEFLSPLPALHHSQRAMVGLLHPLQPLFQPSITCQHYPSLARMRARWDVCHILNYLLLCI